MAAVDTTLRYVAASALLAAAGYCVATTAVLIVEGPAKPSFQTDATAVPASSASPSLALTPDDIGEWRLFGVPLSDQPDPAAITEVPDTKLNLSLLGIFHANGTQDGWAIIVQDEKLPELVRSGERFQNLKVARVLRDRVILDRGGRMEQLMLTAFSDLNVSEVRAAPEPPKVPASDNDTTENLTDRELLLRRNGLEPVNEGSAAGYRVTDKATRLQNRFGLEEGDVILSVNGYSIGAAAEDEMAYQSFQQSGVAQFSVQRDGTTFMTEYRP